MKFCPNCGASLAGGAASFCPECGFALKQAGAGQAVQAEEARTTPPDAADAPKVVHKAPGHTTPAEPVPPAAVSDKPKKKHKPRRQAAPEQAPPDTAQPEPAEVEDPSPSPPEDGYDGYYEDTLPIDDGQRKTEKLDPDMLKKVALIAGGALVFVAAAIVALLLM